MLGKLSILRKIGCQVLLRHNWPLVDTIQDRDRHSTTEMRLDMTVQYEGSWVHHLIANRHPRRGSICWRCGEPITQRRVDKVEILWYNSLSFCNSGPVPCARA